MYSFSANTFAPALINSDGTLIAAMCRSNAGKQWGYIEIVTQKSEDGGKTWSEPAIVAAPPARAISKDLENTKSAFFLNPVLAKAANGDIIMLLSFFPESKGAADKKYLEKKKMSYTYFDGEKRPIIYDRDGSFYIIMSDGAVIDKAKAKTTFKVTGIGELYKDDEYVGNIYLNGAKGKSETEQVTTYGSELKTPKRSYVFMLKSSDGGASWSEPRNITPSILTENDGPIVLTANGCGLTTESGRIIMPLYTDKASFSIYSDDNGETWCRNPRAPYTGGKGKWSAIVAPDGNIQAFSEGKSAASADNGIVWFGGEKVHKKADKVKGAKSAVVLGSCSFLTAKSGKKGGGSLFIADFAFDKKDKYKGFKWRKEATAITEGDFDAPAIIAINDNALAVAFEDGDKVSFTNIDVK